MLFWKGDYHPEGKMYSPSLRKQHTFRADSKEELSDMMFVENNWKVMERK